MWGLWLSPVVDMLLERGVGGVPYELELFYVRSCAERRVKSASQVTLAGAARVVSPLVTAALATT